MAKFAIGGLLIGWFVVVTFAQRQYFQVRPANVTTSQGDTALLQCTVGNQAQQGHTHWTKDGAVLGFEDSLPGWPRYRVIGNHAQGEYHLEISGAEIEDDAEYECQVQPGEGDDNGLRARAYLNVLVPPTNVSLDSTRNGAIIETRMDIILEVSCRVSGAKPAADVRWYKNGTPVPERMYQNRQVTQDEKRFATVSHLRWTATKEDNGAVFTCDVVHPALPASRSLKTQFTLSVLYSPGVPAISGYDIGRTLMSDEFLQLRCVVENGNPQPDLVWYRNSILVGRNSTPIQGYTRNDYGFMVKSIDDEADYRCEASNLATVTPLSSSVRLKVYFPPEKVEIIGPDEATVGDRINFECKSSASNPQAKIEWMVDGHPWTDHSQRNKPADVGTGIESLSSIEVKVTQTRPEMIIVCTSTNERLPRTAKHEAVQRKTVKIYYPPESVKITYNEDKPMVSGETILITCTATGGYPAATLEWFRNEKRVTTGTSSKHGAGNSAISELTLQLSPHNNLEQVQCRAFNLASGSDRLIDTTVLHVQFPPSFVRISPDPAEFRAGSPAELVCDSGSGNPSPTVEWFRDDELLPSVMAHNKTGSHGGWTVKKKLYLSPTLEDNNAVYECRALASIPKAEVVSEKVALSVHYKPIFSTSTTTQTLEVLEGESILLNATANANPLVDQYMWFKDDLTSYVLRSTPPRLLVNGPILEMLDVRRTDAGTYTCRANNRVGVADMTAVVTVKYPADIKRITPKTYAVLSDNVTLTCEVDAYPMDTVSIRWETVEGDRLAPAYHFMESTSGGKGALTIFGIRKEDTGEYVCRADNGIGSATEKTAVLVKQTPIFDKESNFGRAAAAVGGEGILNCVVDGVPEVILNWHRDARNEFGVEASVDRLQENERIHISMSKIGLTRYASELRIRNVQDSDYGTYHCVAENEMGTKNADVKFGVPGAPDTPGDIRVLNLTHEAATLSWKPGFNGGLGQRYRVCYVIGHGTYKSQESPFVNTDEPVLTISNLQSQTKYEFLIQAFNERGASDYARSDKVETLGASSVVQEIVEEEIPVLIIILVCLVGVFLLVLNAALVVCFIRRHRRKKLQEKAANARLGVDPTVGGRKIQMYSSDQTTGTTGAGSALAGNVSPTMTGRGGGDSQYGNVSDGELQLRPQSAMSDDDTSIRTVIEVDGSAQPFFNRLDASPRLMHPGTRTAMDNGCAPRDYGGNSPGNGPFGDSARSNSLQRQLISNGMYSVPSTSFHPDQNKNPYGAVQIVEDVVPPTLGPLRSISQELNNYAAFSHYHPLTSASAAARHQHGPRRYSPPQSSQPGSISTVVHTNGRTPYAEVRPILTTGNHSHHHHHNHNNPSTVVSGVVQSQMSNGTTTNGDRNGGSPILSTFAPTTPRQVATLNAKTDYLDMDGLAGDLV